MQWIIVLIVILLTGCTAIVPAEVATPTTQLAPTQTPTMVAVTVTPTTALPPKATIGSIVALDQQEAPTPDPTITAIKAENQRLAVLRTEVSMACGISTQQVAYDQATVGTLLQQDGLSNQASAQIALGEPLLELVIQEMQRAGIPPTQDTVVDCGHAFVEAANTILAYIPPGS